MSLNDSDQTRGMAAPEQNAPDKDGSGFAQAKSPAEQASGGHASDAHAGRGQSGTAQTGAESGPQAGETEPCETGEPETAQAHTGQTQSGQAQPDQTEPSRRAKASGKRWNLPPAPSNPYLAGVFLGLTLLASYLILGAGLGASGALARLGAALEHAAAPAHTLASAYFGRYFPDPLQYYLVFMFAGILLGGALSALTGARFSLRVERGPSAARLGRLGLALAGGVLSGFAARLAQGCTSGQGLSGGALLLTGSMVFLACVFTAGYLTAWIFGRQWK